MKILKFGGSSLGSPERIRNVVDIVLGSKERHSPIAVVVSAFQGVTNQLIKTGAHASRRDPHWLNLYRNIREMHMDFARALLSMTSQGNAPGSVNTMLETSALRSATFLETANFHRGRRIAS